MVKATIKVNSLKTIKTLMTSSAIGKALTVAIFISKMK